MHSTPRASTSGFVKRTRILAIDYGRKRLGLAISDELGLTARPLATWARTNRRNDIRRLRDLARAHGVARIVVGYPLHLDGAVSEMAEEARRFATRIQKELGLPVELADERLSSWAAHEMLQENAPERRRRAGKVDDVAAAVILRDYLGMRAGKEKARR